MPFTPAHPAILLPLLGHRTFGLDRAALIAGTLAPDFEYFLRFRLLGTHGHTAWGLLYFDLPIALALVLVFERLLRIPLIAAAPAIIRNRLTPPAFAVARSRGAGGWAIAGGSALLGAASHLLWDGFTHPTGAAVQVLPVLSGAVTLPKVGAVPVYKLLQHGSTFAGLLAIALFVGLHLRARSVDERLPPGIAVRVGMVSSVGLCFVGAVAVRLMLSGFVLGHVVVAAISGALLGLVVGALLVRGRTRAWLRTFPSGNVAT